MAAGASGDSTLSAKFVEVQTGARRNEISKGLPRGVGQGVARGEAGEPADDQQVPGQPNEACREQKRCQAGCRGSECRPGAGAGSGRSGLGSNVRSRFPEGSGVQAVLGGVRALDGS